MRKTTVTKINVFQREPYRSIINLIIEFPRGLQQRHLRYALIKNNDGVKTTDIEMMLKPLLPKLIKKGIIAKNCVSSRQNLNKFVQKLSRMGILKQDNRYTMPRYKIDRTFRYDKILNDLNSITKFHWEQNGYMIYEDSKNPSTRTIIFDFEGNTTFEKKDYSQVVKDKLKHHIEAINEHINEIEALKYYHRKSHYELFKKYSKYRVETPTKWSIQDFTKYAIGGEFNEDLGNEKSVDKNHLGNLFEGMIKDDRERIISALYNLFSIRTPLLEYDTIKELINKVGVEKLTNFLMVDVFGMTANDASDLFDDLFEMYKNGEEMPIFYGNGQLVYVQMPLYDTNIESINAEEMLKDKQEWLYDMSGL